MVSQHVHEACNSGICDDHDDHNREQQNNHLHDVWKHRIWTFL